jgi:hypothetical protein
MGIVQGGTSQVERTFRIYNHLSPKGLNHYIASLECGYKLQLVAEPIAASAGYLHTKYRAFRLVGQKCIDFLSGRFGKLDQAIITKPHTFWKRINHCGSSIVSNFPDNQVD